MPTVPMVPGGLSTLSADSDIHLTAEPGASPNDTSVAPSGNTKPDPVIVTTFEFAWAPVMGSTAVMTGAGNPELSA